MARLRWQANALSLFAVYLVSNVAGIQADEANVGTVKSRTTFKLPTGDPATADEHPLKILVRQAEIAYRDMRREVRDYSCIMVRRERVDGRLGKHEFIYAKVRNRQVRDGKIEVPFGVYLKFLKPNSIKGREVLYVEGKNDGKMFVRRGGTRFAFVTTRLDPNSELAMRENRYPVTEFGIENLLLRLIQRARTQLAAGSDCEVDYLENVTVNGRIATGIVIKPSSSHDEMGFYEARVFVDNEWNIPIHYEAYAAPAEDSDQPRLLEQYTYTKLRLNVGYTDADFDEANPSYQVK
ncbi:MAG: DUF1571 domain-containing protein [Planctomycetaceae bacterium]|nr:DUF1571 domain-containing protein [Planctomycetaceae bacterium]